MQNINRLKELFIPDGYNGSLTWKVDCKKYKAGDVVSAEGIKSRYKIIKVDGVAISLHRVLWLMLEGEIAQGKLIDHINGNSHDNRISNLRLCSHAENMRNRKCHSNNQTGLKGVYKEVTRGKVKPWRAQIRTKGKKINLGRFESAEDAHHAYLKASESLHGAFHRSSE